MSKIVSGLFGSGGGEDVTKALLNQERAQREALSGAVNTEAAADQQLAGSRRRGGGRRLLEYLGDSGTLG